MAVNQLLIKDALRSLVDQKLEQYEFKFSEIPFQTTLLGSGRMGSYSFSHSVSTTIGTFHEVIACLVAASEFEVVKEQVALPNTISAGAQEVIDEIINDISTEKSEANHEQEIERLRTVASEGQLREHKGTKVDVWLENGNTIYMIDIKTAKPNKPGWNQMKRTLLTWVAQHLYENPDAQIRSIIGIPYNPNHPETYDYPTNSGMLDISSSMRQVLVGSEFWQFLSGVPQAMQQILQCYVDVGDEKREAINQTFSKLRFSTTLYE